MKKLLLLLGAAFLATCKDSNKGVSMLYDLSSANDAYDYPNLANKNDTDIYIYQLKNILNRQDSFIYVTYGSTYLKQFDEKNLSLRPQVLETFRFSYCPFGGPAVNITFNKNELIVKRGTEGQLYPIYNERKLDSLELIKFRFLERNFFVSKSDLGERRLKHYDSMVAKYPELTSIRYYKELINKCTDYDSLPFKYTMKRIPLTNKQYISLLDSLKKSNFDNVPWKIVYPESVSDGGGYTFEANTKEKFKYFVCLNLPIDTLPMTGFCRYLLQVAKIDKDINL